MNPNNNNEMVSTLPNDPVNKQPHPVNQITPVSKYLALALFVILPFVGAYVGYQLALEKVVEINVLNNEHSYAEINADRNIPANINDNLYIDNEYGFSFVVPINWQVSNISMDDQFSVPSEGLKHLLIKKYDESKGIIISIVPKDQLGDYFGCYKYVFNNSEKNYVRQIDTFTDRCSDAENVISADAKILNSNYVVASTSVLKSSNRNPVSILIPFLPKFGFNIAVIDWKGETEVGEIDIESKAILNSLKIY